jgi:hypothetical protein
MDMFFARDFASPEECVGLIALTYRDAAPSKRFSPTADSSFRTSHTCYFDPADPLASAIDRRSPDCRSARHRRRR